MAGWKRTRRGEYHQFPCREDCIAFRISETVTDESATEDDFVHCINVQDIVPCARVTGEPKAGCYQKVRSILYENGYQSTSPKERVLIRN